MLNNSITLEEADQRIYNFTVRQVAFDDFAMMTPLVDQTLSRLDNRGAAERFDVAGWPIYYEYSPEAGFYLRNAGDESLVRDMQGEVFKFPTTSNLPSEVAFTLPNPPSYSQPSDLYFMPIMQIASLLRSGAVDCVTVVQAFIDRLAEFDPYLAIVSTPLYDRALAMAASHDALLAGGTDLGPLMCIPYGVKDHHQVFDDEPTTYGNIIYSNHTQTIKSTLMAKLMEGGAIPIAKMLLGTFASGSVHGWGDCMSPYLNGEGGGSSCGPGSGAALGALPFGISEETSGSIASPAYNNLISGHIGSYGSISRAGAGLLTTETDHLGFHSRYLSDFGVIFNYARTGADPLDGDSLDVPYVNPADVNLTALHVMIIVGNGSWVFDTNRSRYVWDNVVDNSRNKAAWHWDIRSQRIIEKLQAAGVTVDAVSLEEATAMWSFNASTPYFNCASPDILTMMSGGPWAQTQEFEFAWRNSGWTPPYNIPTKDYRYMRHCMVEMGRRFLNDGVWAKYDGKQVERKVDSMQFTLKSLTLFLL